eukprot:gene23319-biopygen7532
MVRMFEGSPVGRLSLPAWYRATPLRLTHEAPGASSMTSTTSSPGEPPSYGIGDYASLGTLFAYLEDMLPLDVRREVRHMLWQPLTDKTIRDAADLWRNKPMLACKRYGLIE